MKITKEFLERKRMEAKRDDSKCRYCNGELTYIEATKCNRCLRCKPMTNVKPSAKRPTKYVDVKMSDARVREIVIEVLEDWHIQKPPLMKSEIEEPEAEDDWRAEAKKRGIKTFQRSKADVLADIESHMAKNNEIDNL